MIIQALQQIIKSGSQTFPIYVGFLKAKDLLDVAEVPNFQNTTSNHDIATNVLTPPVKQWQRPLLGERRDRIVQTFDGTGEFMPNPVLVAERCVGSPPTIQITQLLANGGIPTIAWEIHIPLPSNGQPPLWIIDGQHRITGLGNPACKQKDNPIPVVFLLNNGGNFYNGRNLAKIFAQVTTEATPLATLHKEWLTFAFKLDSYTAGSPKYKAMETVANLCKMPQNNQTGKVNSFHDDIKFNDVLATSPKFLGHQYDCKDLSSIISQYYFSETSNFGHLDPPDLACQISTAFDVLKKNVRAPQDKSVFFGDKRHCHKIMCDAYLVGIFSFIRNKNGNPTEGDWDNLLKALRFNQTDWNFQQHVVASSRWVDKSKALALDVFSLVFANSTLPANVSDIWDYLNGDQMFVEFEFKHLNNRGNAIKRNSISAKFGRGDKKTVPMDKRKYFKVCARSINAKHIDIVDEKSSPSDPIKFKITGEYLKLPKVDLSKPSQDPLTLTIKCSLYGGTEERITISLTDWK